MVHQNSIAICKGPETRSLVVKNASSCVLQFLRYSPNEVTSFLNLGGSFTSFENWRRLKISASNTLEVALLEIVEIPQRNSEESHIFQLVPLKSVALSEAKGSSSKVKTHSLQAVCVHPISVMELCGLCWNGRLAWKVHSLLEVLCTIIGEENLERGILPILRFICTQIIWSLWSFPLILQRLILVSQIEQGISEGKALDCQVSFDRSWIAGSWIKGTGWNWGTDAPSSRFLGSPSPPKESRKIQTSKNQTSTRLSLSSAFERFHPTAQKAVPRTAGKTKSNEHFEGRFFEGLHV